MNITVKYFAVLRELVGKREEVIDCPEAQTVAGLLADLEKRYPKLESTLARVAVAVNEEYSSRDVQLKDGEEVALLPPVAGG